MSSAPLVLRRHEWEQDSVRVGIACANNGTCWEGLVAFAAVAGCWWGRGGTRAQLGQFLVFAKQRMARRRRRSQVMPSKMVTERKRRKERRMTET